MINEYSSESYLKSNFKYVKISKRKDSVFLLFDNTVICFDLNKELKEKIAKHIRNPRKKIRYYDIKKVKIPKYSYRGFLIAFDNQKQIYIYNEILIYNNKNIIEVYVDSDFRFESNLLNEILCKCRDKLDSYKIIKLELELLRVRYHVPKYIKKTKKRGGIMNIPP